MALLRTWLIVLTKRSEIFLDQTGKQDLRIKR